jgi:DNA-binding CsgD family transcriptional regulator
MIDISDLFWKASLQEIKQGYVYQQDNEEYICLICGKTFVKGLIYNHDDQLYEAEKCMKCHITHCHHSSFDFLLNLDKKITGLTDHQKSILELFYQGHSDNEIAKTLGVGSTSTIRNHRFSLREKQKQAKIFLAIMEILGEQTQKKDAFIEIPRNSRQVDDRFAITEQENAKILATYFKQGLNGPLELFPLKEKRRVIILRHILKQFDANKNYTEKEVNAILKPLYDDYVLLRRNLIEYGFMDRTQDGSSYWVKL